MTDRRRWDNRYDVVVVGGGGAGMAAALSAAESDPDDDVLLIQKDDALGGVTKLAMGSFTAAGTPHQAEAGIDDSADAHFKDMDKFVEAVARGPGRRAFYDYDGDIEEKDDLGLRRVLVDRGAETLTWLQDMGCEFAGPYEEGYHRVPRMHLVLSEYDDVLGARLEAHGVTTMLETAATELLTTETGAVEGVTVETDGDQRSVAAEKGVILAAGSYVNDRDLRERYTSDSGAEPIYELNTGDGHRMAADAGARLVNMDIQSLFLRCEPPLLTGPDFASLVDAGAVLVNEAGERFIDEACEYDQIFDSVLCEPDRRMYVLFDDAIAEAFRSWPRYISTFAGKPWGYVDDYLETDFLEREADLEALAAHVDADAETLHATVERYNRGVEYDGPGTRDEFGRTHGRTRLDTPPWYLLGPMRPYAAVTNGGVDIDREFRVLDEAGEVVPGLYAAGSVAGGVHLFGHGHHHNWIFTSGRLAGRNV